MPYFQSPAPYILDFLAKEPDFFEKQKNDNFLILGEREGYTQTQVTDCFISDDLVFFDHFKAPRSE